MRKYHAGFGREGVCFLPEAIRAWQHALTSDGEGVRVQDAERREGGGGKGSAR